jgi:hypothetical protein
MRRNYIREEDEKKQCELVHMIADKGTKPLNSKT